MEVTLNQAEQLLMEDLEEYAPRILAPKLPKKKPIPKDDPFKQQDFFRYLVSVASHTIGLRSSVKPFNSTEEHMLHYLVDVFGIEDFDRLKNILLSYRDSEAEKDRVDPQKLNQIIQSRRRHSWRPQLRVRIKPPAFYYRESYYIDNLSVRVYLFREDDSTKGSEELEDDNLSQEGKNQRTVLNSVIRRSKIDNSNRIRPVNEMRCLVKFEPLDHPAKDSTTEYKMVQISSDKRVEGDIFLKIRRRYCEPGSKYTLRFEFWLNSEAVESKWTDPFRRYLKRSVFNGPSFCGGAKKSVYQNEDQEFYGYVNYKLDQLPSHPIKLNRAIMTLQRRKLNNCEICIEASNRRLEADDKGVQEEVDTSRVVPNQDFIINHIRLYANFFLHQALRIIRERGDLLVESYTLENVTIDNLFYMSAQTLINQHRLQSNLNKSEDQSLRRTAFIILMNCLESKFMGYDKDANIMLDLLISLAKNEYVMAGKIIDDKTLQELNPFLERIPSRKSDAIVAMEIAALRRFGIRTLQGRVKKYFLPIHKKDELNRIVTLAGLAMYRRALTHHEKLGQIHFRVKNLNFDVAELRKHISIVIDVILERHLRLRFESLIKRDYLDADLMSKSHSPRGNGGKREEVDSWPAFLRDIRGLNNDLSLYWSSKGMERLETSEEKVSKKINIIENTERQNLLKLIKLKIDDFLK